MIKWKLSFLLTCVLVMPANMFTMDAASESKQTEQQECEICFDDVSAKDFVSLGCGHNVGCAACARDIIRVAHNDGSLLRLQCSQDGCNYAYQERDFRAILPAQQLNEVLHAWQYERRVENREVTPRVFRWMNEPAADGRGPRARMCTRCVRIIERNQGCNHMTCRRESGGCGAQFCYMCLADWNGNHYNCYQRVQQERLAKCSKLAPVFFTEKNKLVLCGILIIGIYLYKEKNNIIRSIKNAWQWLKKKFTRKSRPKVRQVKKAITT